MSGKHHGGHHGGHRHGGGRRFRGGFLPFYAYEIGCNPNDPLYLECLDRFGSENAPSVGGLLDNAFTEANEAIRTYFVATEAHTPEARIIKDEFLRWYDDLTWFGKGLESTLDLSRNQRNRFNLANATTPEEKSQVEDVIKTGLTAEQLAGGADRRLSTGMLPGPVAPPPPPLIPTKYLVAGGVGLTALVLLQLSRR